jgi:asparagine synthase (glutamine-hydrolysing)
MCGIAGYFGPNPPSEHRLHEAGNTLAHRGPSGFGVYRRSTAGESGVGLVHRRLAIIDLDPRSNQPFRRGDGVLVYNGEIYNYIEIRKELHRLGHDFKTTGDTEVLAAALLEWGVDCLDKLEGMWSFAWYRESDGSLLLSRDRFGEKPLYFHKSTHGLYFASEPKAIFSLLGEKLPINHSHLKRYLVNGYKSLHKTRETFFDGLEEVPPAHLVHLRDKRFCSSRYWNPNFNCRNPAITFEDAVDQTRSLLTSSVKLRLRSDVPIAFCLSGGIDSNALISIASKNLGYDCHGFTIMNTDSRYEEADLVETAVNELGIRHTKVGINSRGFLEKLRAQITSHDSPISTITYFAQWLLMGAIHEMRYQVSVSGTGADEMFSGYYDHHLAYLQEISKNFSPFLEGSLKSWRREIEPWVRNPYLRDPYYFIDNPDSRDHIFLDNKFFSSLLVDPYVENFTEESYCEGLLRNRMLNEVFHEIVPVLLHEDDLNAMHFSIENRSPFLDRRLFEFCQSIPTLNLIQNGRAKAVLREAVRGLASEVVLNSAKKIGFNAPIFDFLDTSDPIILDSLLSDSPVFNIVKRKEIYRLLNQESLSNSRSKFLFNFICVKFFLEDFG